MKKKIITTMTMLCLSMAALAGCGQQAATPEETESAVESTQEETTQEETTQEAVLEEKTLEAVVLDGSMHYMLVQTTDGDLVEVSIPDSDENVVDLEDGMRIGSAVKVTYTGDTDNMNVISVTDSDKAIKMTEEQFMVYASIMQSVAYKDLNLLASVTAFPVAYDGTIIETEEELLELGADKVFTAELMDAVSGTDVFALEEVEAGFVLGEENNIIFRVRDDVEGIVGINHSK